MATFDDDIVQMKPAPNLVMDLAAEGRGCITKDADGYWINFDAIHLLGSGKACIEVAFYFKGKKVSSMKYSGGFIPAGQEFHIGGIEGRSSVTMRDA